jgi:MFS family permease
MLGATAVGSFIGGAINAKKNLTFYTLIASSTLQVVGIGLMTTLNNVATDVSAQYGFQVLIGFAVGLCFSAGTVLTSLHVPSNMLATGHGILSQARIMGGCVGIAVCTVVFQYTASPEVQHEDGSTGETVDPRVKYADGFYENVKIMLYVATVSVFVSILTLEWNPPQMRTLRQHRLNLDNNEEAGRRSISTKGSRSTELREIENSPLTVPSDGKV